MFFCGSLIRPPMKQMCVPFKMVAKKNSANGLDIPLRTQSGRERRTINVVALMRELLRCETYTQHITLRSLLCQA